MRSHRASRSRPGLAFATTNDNIFRCCGENVVARAKHFRIAQRLDVLDVLNLRVNHPDIGQADVRQKAKGEGPAEMFQSLPHCPPAGIKHFPLRAHRSPVQTACRRTTQPATRPPCSTNSPRSAAAKPLSTSHKSQSSFFSSRSTSSCTSVSAGHP